jgi:hypothetical protein
LRYHRALPGSVYRLSKKEDHYTPRIDLDELDEVITSAFACFSALFSLY